MFTCMRRYKGPNTIKKHPQHRIYPYLLRKLAIKYPSIAADPKRLGARVGMTRVLHTLGIGVMLNARLWRDPITLTST